MLVLVALLAFSGCRSASGVLPGLKDLIRSAVKEDSETNSAEEQGNKETGEGDGRDETDGAADDGDGISGGSTSPSEITNSYAYGQLNETGKSYYDVIYDAVLHFQESVSLPGTDQNVLKKAYTALSCDHGELFWLNGYSYTSYKKGNKVVRMDFEPVYTMDLDTAKEKQTQIEQVCAEWLSGAAGADSDYQRAKYVFEVLIENVSYVEDAADSQNILSVFLNRQTVCTGYAQAAQYLLKKLGISSCVVTGNAYENGTSGAHAWNLVCLEGDYYYMDVTWGNGRHYNAESAREEQFIDYNYLCMTDEEADQFYRADQGISYPACSSLSCNYYVREGRYFDSWDPDAIGAAVLARLTEEGAESSVKFATDELYETAKDYLITQGRIADYVSGNRGCYYMESEEFHVLTFGL